jgi:hypothetical protein
MKKKLLLKPLLEGLGRPDGFIKAYLMSEKESEQ